MWGLVYVMWVVIGLIGGVEGGQYGTGCTGVFKTPGGSKKEDAMVSHIGGVGNHVFFFHISGAEDFLIFSYINVFSRYI